MNLHSEWNDITLVSRIKKNEERRHTEKKGKA